MEARIARLESDVGHIRTDMVDVKTDVRALRDKMDNMNTSLSDRIDYVNKTLTTRIDVVNQTLTVKIDDVKDSIASVKIWALMLYIALAGGLFGTLARGFGWL